MLADARATEIGGWKNRLISWGIPFLVSSFISVGATFYNSMANQSQRITVLETQMQGIAGRLERIEKKMDAMLTEARAKP